MTFVDRLREYLRRAASSPVRKTILPDLDADLPLYRKHLLEGLERLEQHLQPTEVEKLHGEWSTHNRLAAFVRVFTAFHLDRLGPDATKQPLQDLVRAAIDAQLGLPLNGSLTWRLEIQDAAVRAWAASEVSEMSSWWRVEPYAVEVRTVRVGADLRVMLTAVGRVALELTGIDFVRWLLQVEAEQSLGPRDPWRLSRATAAFLVEKRRGIILKRGHSGPSFETLGRLYNMGILDQLLEHDDRHWSYAVHGAAVPILEEITERADTPLRVLAATLLNDDRNVALARAQPDLARLFGEEAAAVGIRQARLVAHEVRNSLVPVQVALEGLYRTLDHVVVNGIDRYRGRIDDGVNRLFKFVDQTLRVLTVAAEPAEPFDVTSAMRDALGSFTAGEAEITQTIPAPGELPPVVGARSRFVLAIVNVVRNSIQANPDHRPKVGVASTLAPDARSIVITIDDDGPGVPVVHRESIFAPGFSLRPGGTGMGLALTREVIEKELGGRVTCTVSPLGGARFEIVLPIIGRGTP